MKASEFLDGGAQPSASEFLDARDDNAATGDRGSATAFLNEGADRPGAISRGFVSGLLEQNPSLMAETFEGLSYLAPEDLRGGLTSGSQSLRDLAKLAPEEYKPRARSLWQSQSVGDVLDWAGEALGSGLASTVPSIVTGTVGAALGGRAAKRPGAVVGGLAGAAVPSAGFNYGEVYKALKDEGIAPENAAEWALYAAAPMVALDTVSLGPIVTRLGGMAEVRRQVARGVARRISVEAAKGTGREGLTEAAQEAVKEAAVSLAADKPFWTLENVGKVAESGIAGALTGGVMGGGAGVVRDKPIGERAKAAQAQPVITPDDEASPIPTDLIAEGKKILAEADGVKAANDILERRGYPPVGARVTVAYPDGRTETGVIDDAFTESNTALGMDAQGVKIKLDGGGTLDEYFNTLDGAGIRVSDLVEEPPAAAPQMGEEPPQAAVPTVTAVPGETVASGQPAGQIVPPAQEKPTDIPLETQSVPEGPRNASAFLDKAVDVSRETKDSDSSLIVEQRTEKAREASEFLDDEAGKEIGGPEEEGGGVDVVQDASQSKAPAAEQVQPASQEAEADDSQGGEQVRPAVEEYRAEAGRGQEPRGDGETRKASEFLQEPRQPEQRPVEAVETFQGILIDKPAKDLTDEEIEAIDKGRSSATIDKRNLELARFQNDDRFLRPALDAKGRRLGIGGAGGWETDWKAVRDYLRDGTLPPRGQRLEDMRRRFVELMQKHDPAFPADTGLRSVSMVLHAAESGKFNNGLRPDNRSSRAIFKEITGVKLPKTLRDTRALFDGKPFIDEEGRRLRAAGGTLPAKREGIFVQIGNRRFEVKDYEDASRRYLAARDRSGKSPGDLPRPLLVDADGKPFGYISDNGRVWRGDPMAHEAGELLYDSRKEGGTLDQTSIARAKGPVIDQPAAGETAGKEATRKGYGQSNRIFTADKAEAARQRLRARLRSQLSSGIDPQILADGVVLAGYHIESGSRAFAAYSAKMIEDLGEAVRPYLRSFYEAVRNYPGFDAAGMTPAAEIEAVETGAGETVEATSDAPGGTVQRKETAGGVQTPVPIGDARARAEDVQPAPAERGAGRAPEKEDARSAPDAERAVGERAEAAERGAGELGGRTRGGGASDGGADRVPAGDRGTGRPEPRADADVKGENFVIETGALQETRSWKVKAQDNIAAIELMRAIEAEGRPATKAEQQKLSRYVGWGGIRGAFPDTEGKFAEGFEGVGKRLKELLSETEYKTARRSIQYAHYTSEAVVRAMWDAAERLGFKGGKVFEPGMGVGNFAGMMPPGLAAAAQYNGLDLDHTTARIARLLYPKWGVRRDDFTKAPLPKDAYDLVIGNPPFADIPVKSDPEYAKHSFLLHDYFFAKSLDAVRPGGLLIFISSAGTMNKADAKAREYMAERADLVGAIRLPSIAFARNAGTEVTTDIIMLRKRLPGEEAKDTGKWVETTNVRLPNKEGKMIEGAVNRYFVEHPKMVIGTEGFFDKLYQNRYAVHLREAQNLEALLKIAIGKLPEQVMSPWQSTEERAEVDFGTAEKKEGSFYLDSGGRLMQMRDGVGRPVARRGTGVKDALTGAEIERIKGLVPIRDALRAVYEADLNDDKANADAARKRLNESYDAFVAKFGPINKAAISHRRPTGIQAESARAEAREEARYGGLPFDEGSFDPTDMLRQGKPLMEVARARKSLREEYEKRGQKFDEGTFNPDDMPDVVIDKRPNVDAFMDDPESYRLRAIEGYDDDTGEAQKRRVFFENVITREKVPQINSVGDALLFVLNKRGRLDIAEIAHAANLTESEAIEKLGDAIFKHPATGQWETRTAYLSGDVRQKLRQAKVAADRNPEFKRNVEALQAVQPPLLPPSEISANLGMPWIPTEVVEEFGRSLGLSDVDVKYVPVLGQWFVKGDRNSAAATSTWGTSSRAAPLLIQDALNRQDPKIYRAYIDDKGNKREEIDPVATQAAQDKVREIKDKFSEWVWSDKERSASLVTLYNDQYNNLVVPEYEGGYLTTPGISTNWTWRPHQKNVIARVIQSGNTYVAHAVGAGKTSVYIGAIMEKRRLGLARKPMVAVPNHMLGQFTKEWYEQYPTARLAIADERRFHTDRRKQFIANVAVEDLDAIIITHSAFGLIPVSQDFQDGIIQEQIDQYEDLLKEMPKNDPETRITRRRIENAKEKLEQRLKGKGKKQDAVFTFEEMGVDDLTIDEAHLYRKLDFATKMGNVKGISPEGSKAAFDLYVKIRYLETINPGRSVTMGSGTPITNTMAELYTVSRYMQPGELRTRGLSHFDSWAGAFGDTITQLEQNAAGGYKPMTRFAKFVNVPELSAMVRQVMDVVTSKQLDKYVTRPALRGGKRQMHLAEKTVELTAYQESLAARMREIEKRKGPPQPGDDILLNVINDGRHAAIDMRLVDPGLPNDPASKLNILVENVYRIWKETKRQPFYKIKAGGGYEDKPFDYGPATQLVFSNLGVGETRSFSVHGYIVAELARRGVPKTEIARIADFKTHVAKQRLFNDVNEGKVRVLIGSTSKMGMGTNVQRRLSDLHNLDPLWYPADDEQRNGRGLRQGNMNKDLGIHDYSTKGTYDSTMWGLMETKARFIEGFFAGDPSIRDMEDLGESSQYEQAKAITTADPRLIKLTELKQELEKARRRRSAFEREQYSMRERVGYAKAAIDRANERIPQIEQDIAQRQDISGDNFRATANGREFTDRAEFGDALLGQAGNLVDAKKERRGFDLGEIGGFKIKADVFQDTYREGKPWRAGLYIQRTGRFQSEIEGIGARGLVQSAEKALKRFDVDLEEQRRRLTAAEREVAEFTPKLDEVFKGQAEIDRLAGEARSIEAELRAEQQQAQKQAEQADTDDEDGAGEDAPVARSGDNDVDFGVRGYRNLLKQFKLRVKASGKETTPAAVSGIARDWVAGNGRADGFEYAVSLDGVTGEIIAAGTSGRDNAVEVSDRTTRAIYDPSKFVVYHHNHPDSKPLSPTDINLLSSPGLGWIVAHSRDGDISAARMSEEAARDLDAARQSERRWREMLVMVQFRTKLLVDAEIRGGTMTAAQADRLGWTMMGRALARAGVIDYVTTRQIDPAIAATANRIETELRDEITRHITVAWSLDRGRAAYPDRSADAVGADAAMAKVLERHARASAGASRGQGGDRAGGGDLEGARGQVLRTEQPRVEPWETQPRDPQGRFSERPERPPNAIGADPFDNPETERRWQEARKGAASGDTLIALTRAWLSRVAHGFARHYIDLPNAPRYAGAIQQLRKLEAAPQASKEKVVRILRDLTKGMNAADLDLFTRKVVLDDLSWEVSNDRDIPFGMSAEDVRREKAKVDSVIEERPDIAAAVRQRKLVVQRVADDLVNAGVLHREQVRNPAYYRHQVLDYARAQVAYAKGTGNRLRSPHWARRMGSTLDINANLLEAEFDWLHKAFTDIETARTIDWIKDSAHNVRNDVIEAAKANNRRLVEEKLADEREEFGDDGGPLTEQWRGFKRRIAMGLSRVRAVLDQIDVPAEFEEAAAALESGTANDESIFPFLSWIMDNDKPGAVGAAVVFKAISHRRLWVKDLLGDRYADPMNVGSLVKRFAPDGYVVWQPDEGKLLFTAKTLPEHVIDRVLNRISAASAGPVSAADLRAAMDSVRSLMAVGGNKFEMVIPEELAATLNSLRDEHAENLITHAFEKPMRAWKIWTLISPRRVLKYNLNNLSGDLDAVIAGNPKALRKLPQAIRELWSVMAKKQAPSARYKEAVERGVFDSGLTLQEIPDINKLAEFETIINPPPVKEPLRFAASPLIKFWQASRKYTQFRENWLRYAAYLDYVERLEAGEPMKSIGYGAARPDMVDAVADKKDRAALLARELVGDYGNVSHWGQGIRRYVMPFYSWLEINTKRYWRFGINAWHQGVGEGLRTTGALGAALGVRATAYLGLRMALLYILVQLWNNLVFGDDEDELSDVERSRLHLNLGRDSDGQIRTLRFQGAFSDFLAWVGFEDARAAMAEIEKGRGGFSDVMKAVVKAPVNKVATGLTPLVTAPMETATGRKLWPDVFSPRPIRDNWRNLAQTFSLENEYDLVMGRPSRGYLHSLEGAVVAKRDAGEAAYNNMKALTYDWLRREKGHEGVSGFTTPRSQALYDWRLARKYGDEEAAAGARERMRELGMRGADLAAAIKRAHPLASVPLKDRAKFLSTLTTKERDSLNRAVQWYRETFRP